jgi:hypothetical protein
MPMIPLRIGSHPRPKPKLSKNLKSFQESRTQAQRENLGANR